MDEQSRRALRRLVLWWGFLVLPVAVSTALTLYVWREAVHPGILLLIATWLASAVATVLVVGLVVTVVSMVWPL